MRAHEGRMARERKVKRYPRLDEVPESADPRWETWTAPLRAFLYKYRCWEEMTIWRKEQGLQESVFIQLLAWLSVNKLAGCSNGEWVAYKDLNEPVPFAVDLIPSVVESSESESTTQ